MKIYLTVLAVFLTPVLYGQVEHNFTMGPNNTTCDSLDTQDMDNAQLIEEVRNTKFRYQEQLKISRYKSPRQLWFYSCDGKTGYLVAKETEDEEIIYPNVSIGDWNELLESTDPISAYKRIKDSME